MEISYNYVLLLGTELFNNDMKDREYSGFIFKLRVGNGT